MAAMEAHFHESKEPDATRIGRIARLEVGHKRSRCVVELETVKFRGVMQPPSAAVAGTRDTRRGSIPPNPRLGPLFEPATRDALHADSMHLLFLGHPLAHYLVHCRFDKTRADPFAVAVSFAI